MGMRTVLGHIGMKRKSLAGRARLGADSPATRSHVLITLQVQVQVQRYQHLHVV